MSRASEYWGEWQKFGARGIKGAEALAKELERIVTDGGIKSPVTSRRGVEARLRYLDSEAGREALKEAGVKERTLRDWQKGKQTPSKRSREKIDAAYQELRTHNVIRSGALKRRLNADGAGTRVEIYPVNQASVDSKRARDVEQRSIQLRYIWDDAVDAWAGGDIDALDAIWGDVITDIDSDYAAYAYVSSIGLGA